MEKDKKCPEGQENIQEPQPCGCPQTEEEQAPSAPQTEEDRIAALESQLAENEERYKRMLAEYDNYRKRCAKEREGLYADSFVAAVALFLPVLDNLERAALQQDQAEGERKGAEMIVKQFLDILEKSGVKPMGEKGEAFDPQRHNAIQHVEDESFGENQICEVLLRGYVMGDRVIRHAMVKVAN